MNIGGNDDSPDSPIITKTLIEFSAIGINSVLIAIIVSLIFICKSHIDYLAAVMRVYNLPSNAITIFDEDTRRTIWCLVIVTIILSFMTVYQYIIIKTVYYRISIFKKIILASLPLVSWVLLVFGIFSLLLFPKSPKLDLPLNDTGILPNDEKVRVQIALMNLDLFRWLGKAIPSLLVIIAMLTVIWSMIIVDRKSKPLVFSLFFWVMSYSVLYASPTNIYGWIVIGSVSEIPPKILTLNPECLFLVASHTPMMIGFWLFVYLAYFLVKSDSKQ